MTLAEKINIVTYDINYENLTKAIEIKSELTNNTNSQLSEIIASQKSTITIDLIAKIIDAIKTK